MNARGSYTAMAGVLMIALLGIAMVSLQAERNARPEWNLAFDARPVWVNALGLIEAQACNGNAAEALALLEQETGYHCSTVPGQIRVDASTARFELACAKQGERVRAEYRRTVALPIAGC